jgi:hypothetical protein
VQPEAWPAPVPHGKTFEGFASPPGGPTTSGLAIASLVCGIFGFLCVTGIVSVGLGLAALISIAGAPHARKGKGLAITGIALSILWLAGMVVAGAVTGALRQSPEEPQLVQGQPAGQPFPVPMPTPAPIPGVPALPGLPVLPGSAPHLALTPVAGPLDSQIRSHVAAAESGGRRLVVFFTAGWCAPCQAVKRTLAAPDLVARLSAVQVVEVDVDAFPDADGRRAGQVVGRQVNAIPLLCTLRSNLPPVCMDGAAWGEDTDGNIRAILVPFLETPPSGLTPGVQGAPVPI